MERGEAHGYFVLLRSPRHVAGGDEGIGER